MSKLVPIIEYLERALGESFQEQSLRKAKAYTQKIKTFLSAKGSAKDKAYFKLVAGWITFKNDAENARLNMGSLPDLLDPFLSPLDQKVKNAVVKSTMHPDYDKKKQLYDGMLKALINLDKYQRP